MSVESSIAMRGRVQILRRQSAVENEERRDHSELLLHLSLFPSYHFALLHLEKVFSPLSYHPTFLHRGQVARVSPTLISSASASLLPTLSLCNATRSERDARHFTSSCTSEGTFPHPR